MYIYIYIYIYLKTFHDFRHFLFAARYGRIYCTIYGTTNLAIHNYGLHSSGAGAEGALPTVVEAAEGRFHIGGW